jgi:tRNA(fMet)-specific endonuclease VapC
MEARFLLGTDICIYVRQKRSASLLQRFHALHPGEAAVSVITYGELLYGAIKRGQMATEREKWRELVHLLPVFPLPVETSEKYGAIRAELEASGKVIGNNDLWIAAHAMAAGLILVTNNEKEFRRVRGLKIKNWANSMAGAARR